MNLKASRWLTATLLCGLALAMLWVGSSAAQAPAGQTPPAAATQEAPPLEPAALDTLKGMSDLLKNAKSFTFTYRTVHEQVAQTGQIVDFFHLSKVALTRPNKLRFDVSGDVRNTILQYDGKVVTLLDPTQGFFAQLEAPATIDETLVLLMDKFQTSFPVAGVLLADPYEKMRDGLNTAVDLGVVKVDGVDCRHLLFGEDEADWQLWVEVGKRPLPRRLSIVYKKAPGAPRMLASFSDWKLNVSVPTGRFVFVKPPQATQVELKTAPPGN
jgi:hypothetical protein